MFLVLLSTNANYLWNNLYFKKNISFNVWTLIYVCCRPVFRNLTRKHQNMVYNFSNWQTCNSTNNDTASSTVRVIYFCFCKHWPSTHHLISSSFWLIQSFKCNDCLVHLFCIGFLIMVFYPISRLVLFESKELDIWTDLFLYVMCDRINMILVFFLFPIWEEKNREIDLPVQLPK